MRVLALNDDNHATSFTTENGETYYNAYQFITKCLAKPHKNEYIVRGFWICDEFDDTILEKYTEEEIQLIFDCVERADEKAYNTDINFDKAFNILWASSSEHWS